MPAKRSSSVATLLLDWYDTNARSLPWRSAPGSNAPDPYRVWLSEIMLQQTTVATVRPRFSAFVARWPTVESLAAASDADLMAAWAGLGYYARARNLIACARMVVAEHGGRFPDTEAALRALPGIGDYTAAAIAAIAFGRRAVAVDANVARVVSRLNAVETPLPGAMATIRAAADTITPDSRAGDFAQAMMDLGSGICTSRNPQCLLCPLVGSCRAHATGDPARFPREGTKGSSAATIWHGLLGRTERSSLADTPAGQRPARRNACAADRPLGRVTAGSGGGAGRAGLAADQGPGVTWLHPFYP